MQIFGKLPQISGLRSIVKFCPDPRKKPPPQKNLAATINLKIVHALLKKQYRCIFVSLKDSNQIVIIAILYEIWPNLCGAQVVCESRIVRLSLTSCWKFSLTGS